MSIDQFLLSGSDTDLNYPNVRPTLDLNFARTKTLDPRITFERASGGSYVGADGLIKYAGVNEPRFDHDPITGESLGLLIEESRTNIVSNSNFSSGWGTGSVILSYNSTISPDGSTTATKITGDGSGNFRSTFASFSVTSGQIYNFSTFFKPDSVSSISLGFLRTSDNNVDRTIFYSDTETFELESSDFTNLGYGYQKYSNGWYRVWTTYQTNSTETYRVYIYPGVYNNNSTDSIYIWGAQLEVGTFPTSYIPTQGSTRTRSADVASITGSNFSSWYNPNEGTVFCMVNPLYTNPAGATPFWELGNGGSTDLIWGGRRSFNSKQFRLNSRTSSIVDVDLSDDNYLSLTLESKISAAYKKNNYAVSVNNSPVVTDTSNTVPQGINRFLILRFVFGSSAANIMSRLVYYNKRLPDSQLQALTR